MSFGRVSGVLGSLNAAVTLVSKGFGSFNWEIDTGTLVGTVVFEATLDDTNYFAIDAIQVDGTIITSVSSFSARGAFTSVGYSTVRLRVSAYTSGTSDARIQGSVGTHVVRIGDSLPAGTSNIGDVDIVSLPDEGEQTMANSISVVIASDQSRVPVSKEPSDWTETATADNAAATATKTAEAGLSHYITSISGSFSAAAIKLMEMKDGATVKGNYHVHNQRDVVFSNPFKITENTDAVLTLAASGGAGTIGAVTMTGFTK